MGRTKYEAGMKWGRLTFTGERESSPNPNGTSKVTRWLMRCDCGVELWMVGATVTTGKARSCGCLRREVAARMLRDKWGDPEWRQRQVGRLRERDTQRGEAHPNWRGSDVGYTGAHMRVASLRGAARDYPCVDCGQPGEDWSLSLTQVEVRELPLASSVRPGHHNHGCLYSPSPLAYEARCKPCHAALDSAARAERRAAA